jgi:hypothetical protein
MTMQAILMARDSTPNELLARLVGTPGGGGLTSDFLDDAAVLFERHGDPTRSRWLRLERNGYGASTEPSNLIEVFGPGAPEAVVKAARASRLRTGRFLVAGIERHWPHFFVESVDELHEWARRLESGGAPTVSVELDISGADTAPVALAFHRSVFTDVLDSIAVEIGAALRDLGERL